ncbi:MAG: hypothetical protein GXP37_15180 [Chloroflexi bacterium]|nr:hypothetical protein [Chloroflexota bacterium]
MRMILLALTAFGLLLLAACSGSATDPLPTAIPPSPTQILLPSPSLMPDPTESPSASESPAASSRRHKASSTPQPRLMQTPVPKGQRVELDGWVYESDGELLQPLHAVGEQAAGGNDFERVAQAALRLVATQLGLTETSLQVRHIQPITWPDASLGCPQEGMLYAQVLTPGYKVMVEAPDATYELHLDANGAGDFCPPRE